MNIAILPENNNYPESPTMITVDNPLISLADYSDKSFVIFGDSTKTHRSRIKELGGMFNGRLKEKSGFPGGPGWIFQMKHKSKVIEFINSVNTGKEKTPVLSECNDELPTTSVSPSRTYQYVKWKLFRPIVGMDAKIKAGNKEIIGKVIDTESHRDIIDTVYVSVGEGIKTKIVICNGCWQVLGYMVDHTVFFSNSNQEKESEDM